MQKALKKLPYTLLPAEDGDFALQCPCLPTGSVFPEQVSAQVLRTLLAAAERFAGQKFDRAVVSVPAYFDQKQRTATIAAGQYHLQLP